MCQNVFFLCWGSVPEPAGDLRSISYCTSVLPATDHCQPVEFPVSLHLCVSARLNPVNPLKVSKCRLR